MRIRLPSVFEGFPYLCHQKGLVCPGKKKNSHSPRNVTNRYPKPDGWQWESPWRSNFKCHVISSFFFWGGGKGFKYLLKMTFLTFYHISCELVQGAVSGYGVSKAFLCPAIKTWVSVITKKGGRFFPPKKTLCRNKAIKPHFGETKGSRYWKLQGLAASFRAGDPP